jgi:hypothetical protein
MEGARDTDSGASLFVCPGLNVTKGAAPGLKSCTGIDGGNVSGDGASAEGSKVLRSTVGKVVLGLGRTLCIFLGIVVTSISGFPVGLLLTISLGDNDGNALSAWDGFEEGVIFLGLEVGSMFCWFDPPCELDSEGFTLGCSEGDSVVPLFGCDVKPRVGIAVGFELVGTTVENSEGRSVGVKDVISGTSLCLLLGLSVTLGAAARRLGIKVGSGLKGVGEKMIGDGRF